MSLKLLKVAPKKSLNAAFLKLRPLRSEMDLFKSNLITLLSKINESESEENQKNHVRDFLLNTYYAGKNEVNTKGRQDLVIHIEHRDASPVGVILETKRPANKSEWISPDKANTKALHELVLYFLRERVDEKNNDIRHLVATNVYEWYIFDASVFDKIFYQNKKLVRDYEAWRDGQKVTKDTNLFYTEIARPFIESLNEEIPVTFFDLRAYDTELRNADKADDKKLIALQKLLSPHHLLRVPFANDSNSLDKRFYSELLHIIGLTETKEGGKKLIGRHKTGERLSGTILEDAIIQIDSLDKLSRISRPGQYGADKEERLFNIALELSITWVNRILFLKLLEGQLVSYHQGAKEYLFLHKKVIREYDDLNTLFFQVLAKRHEDRHADVRHVFERVPYLNSSLFEPTELEHETIFISNLRDEKTIPVHSQTVLKDSSGKKRTGDMPTLEYLFEFLNAYDFSSEGSEDIQEDNKTLINASVLGLIFEKINGYKDGSFFTPGFITMYMCRETIRRAVVQKFNEAKSWSCTDLTQLYNKIEDRTEANTIVNSLHICDPAVGSGHFLVSALNEIIAIKGELGILQDENGKRLRDYKVEVINDELIIKDENGDLFAYNPKNAESSRIQKTLFHEKQTIIENCLFGVDINPNSVKICRLRMWIELLKNAYYKGENELETLPNIDINIKCGNSLVSRFALDADIRTALKKSKWTIDTYQNAVSGYKNAENKEEKRELERLINDIKSDFRSEIGKNDPLILKRNKMQGELFNLSQETLFPRTEKEQVEVDKKINKLQDDITKIEADIESIKANKIYENAFEWRFEFPEVLNEEGDFVGFDVVIGNPPYVPSKEIDDKEIKYLTSNYYTTEYQINTYSLFCELGVNLLKKDYYMNYIIPNYWLSTKYDYNLRKLLFINNYTIELLNVYSVFESAVVDTLLVVVQKKEPRGKVTRLLSLDPNHKNISNRLDDLKDRRWFFNKDLSIETNLINDISFQDRISLKGDVELGDLFDAKFGIKVYQVGKGKPPQTKEIIENNSFQSERKISEDYYPILRARDVARYYVNQPKVYVKYGSHLAEPRSLKMFIGPRVLVQRIVGKKYLSCVYVENEMLCNSDIISFFPKNKLDRMSILGITGIINSNLCLKFLKSNNINLDRDVYPKINTSSLDSFPIRLKFENLNEIALIVEEIQSLKFQDPSADTTSLEAEIDRMVYDLYGLTEEERKIVEGE